MPIYHRGRKMSDIVEMMEKIDKVYTEHDEDTPVQRVKEALEWVLGHHDDSILEQYLEI